MHARDGSSTRHFGSVSEAVSLRSKVGNTCMNTWNWATGPVQIWAWRYDMEQVIFSGDKAISRQALEVKRS